MIGAGPAGSACARTLARAGVDVLLADQHAFPRDKVCGDGLIPDAHAALARLGVLDQVMAQRATRRAIVGCVGPRGGRVDVPGTMAVLPREQLDDILCQAAVAAGARMLPPARFESPLEEAGRVVGARLKVGEAVHEVRARLAGAGHRRRAAGADRRRHVRAPHAERHRAARLREERRNGRPHHRARRGLAPQAAPRLRLDLSLPRRRVQHRRRHRPQPQHAERRPARHEGREPARGLRRLHRVSTRRRAS